MTGLLHDSEKGFDVSKIHKTFFKSFGLFNAYNFLKRAWKIINIKKSLEQSSRDFTVGMTGFEPATPSTPC